MPQLRSGRLGCFGPPHPELRAAPVKRDRRNLPIVAELLEEGAQPRLALLDVMMPVMNGIEFLDALRERHLAPDMHVVLVSAHVRIAKHVHYPGVTGLLPKPFGPEELLEIVRRHCPDPGADTTEH